MKEESDSIPDDSSWFIGLEPLREIEDEYFFNSFFKRVKPEMAYSRNRVLMGVYKKTKQPFYLDTSEALRILILGMTRCLHKDTEVLTTTGAKRICEVQTGDMVYGYNHRTHMITPTRAEALVPRTRKLHKVTFTNGATVTASLDHKFFIATDDYKGPLHTRLHEIPLKDVTAGTELWGMGKYVVQSIEPDIEILAYDLYVPETNNFMLANGLLTHNSGKTWLMRGMGDRLHEAGRAVIYISDVKNEFQSSKRPLQPKFHKLLDSRETAKAMPVIALRPTFFHRNDDGRLPLNNNWYSINPLQLEQEDFFTLMNVNKMTPSQQTMMTLVFTKIKDMWKGREHDFNMKSFYEVIDAMDDFTEQQKHYVKVRFQPLLESNFYREEYQRNIISMMREGFIPAINMENFDAYSQGSAMNLPQAFMSICVRQVIFARRKKLIPPVFIMMDEASRFVPNDSEPSTRKLIEQSVDLDAKHGIMWCFATQQLVKTPQKIISQCKYIFLPHNADVSDIASVLKQFGFSKVQTANNDAARIKRQMGRYEWLVLDKNRMRYDVIQAIAPLSAHAETSN